jgi:phage tail-like protein
MASHPEPYANNHFRVEIDGIQATDFAEIVLPEARADIIEYREGGDRTARKFPGAIHFSNLVLRRGVVQANELFQWWNNVANGIADRRNVAVVLLDGQLQPVKRWAISGALPARFAISPLVALGEASTVIETLECAIERFEVV